MPGIESTNFYLVRNSFSFYQFWSLDFSVMPGQEFQQTLNVFTGHQFSAISALSSAQHQGAAKDGGGENINIILISESAHFPSRYLR